MISSGRARAGHLLPPSRADDQPQLERIPKLRPQGLSKTVTLAICSSRKGPSPGFDLWPVHGSRIPRGSAVRGCLCQSMYHSHPSARCPGTLYTPRPTVRAALARNRAAWMGGADGAGFMCPVSRRSSSGERWIHGRLFHLVPRQGKVESGQGDSSTAQVNLRSFPERHLTSPKKANASTGHSSRHSPTSLNPAWSSAQG